jgi:hypothetical protein
MDTDKLLSRLALALGIGLLIGLERGWRTRALSAGSRAAGIRTFALCGLLGGVVASLANATGAPAGAGLVLGFGFAVFAAVIAVFERDANRAADTYSATTIIAAMLTFLLGAYAVLGDTRVAAAAPWLRPASWPPVRTYTHVSLASPGPNSVPFWCCWR